MADYTGIQEHTLPAPRGLVVCDHVLDIGTGIRPMQWYRPGRHWCVEPWPAYCDILREGGYEVVQTDAKTALGAMVAEAVYMLDVIEHMEKADALQVLELAKSVATVQVVIHTPYGFIEQATDPWGYGAHDLQSHRSGWLPEEFKADGWRTQLFHPHPTLPPEGFYALWEPSTRS